MLGKRTYSNPRSDLPVVFPSPFAAFPSTMSAGTEEDSFVCSATIVVPADFREVVADATLIVRGHITDVRSVVTLDKGIESIGTIAVDSTLKGDVYDFVSMRVPEPSGIVLLAVLLGLMGQSRGRRQIGWTTSGGRR